VRVRRIDRAGGYTQGQPRSDSIAAEGVSPVVYSGEPGEVRDPDVMDAPV